MSPTDSPAATGAAASPAGDAANATVNDPRNPDGTALPSVSRTWLARIETLNVPLSAASHVPPGAVMRYVTVRAVPAVVVTPAPMFTTAGIWLNPPGPVTCRSPPSIVVV